jgi:hypothetical protein
MKLKNLFAGILAGTVLLSSAVTAFASDIDSGNATGLLSETDEKLSTTSESTVIEAYFGFFTGTVTRISASENGMKYISLESSDKKEATIVVSGNTYVVNADALVVGATVTGYYEANAPMLMIYPPQYNAEAVVVESKENNVKVDVFDKDLVSSDGFLKLNISADTEIILQDGTAFKGDLTGRKLIAVYDVSTKSIPAQTTPSKVIVLFEKAVPVQDVSSMSILVDGKKIEAVHACTNEQGTVMIPLRSISEALGLTVTWDKKQKSVTVGKGISLTPGKDYYVYMRTAPIQLGTAPVIKEGRTFVPLSFFTEVAKLKEAKLTDSQIVINSK